MATIQDVSSAAVSRLLRRIFTRVAFRLAYLEAVLLLVRHAMPEIDPAIPAHDWPLSADGQAGANLLAGLLPSDAVLVASAELKARQTLEPAGDVRVDARFNEVARDEPFDDDFRARRRSYVSGGFQPHWESRLDVTARFDAAVGEWLGFADGRPLVIGTHGITLTVWLSATVGLDDPAGFWSALALPDLLEVDLAGRSVTRRPVRSP
jgi:2,3-bisphosphoglycerate-dependent phosphoglycerate mutase